MKKAKIFGLISLGLFSCIAGIIYNTDSDNPKTPQRVIEATVAPSRTTTKTKPRITLEHTVPATKDTKYRPGTYCATSRLGLTFKKNGSTYQCKGPKPYRWRKIS